MDHHLFAAVRPISRFHTEFRGSRDTDEQYLRRRGSDQHSGDHRNGSEKNKADEKQDHIMDQNPDAHSHYLPLCLITHDCSTLSITLPRLSSAGQFPAASYSAFVYGYRLLCRPFGRHRHLLGRSAPSPVPKRLSHCFTCSFFSLSSSSFSLSTICFAILYALRPPERTPRIRKIRTV